MELTNSDQLMASMPSSDKEIAASQMWLTICNVARWSARFGFEKTGKQILEKAKSGCNGRYVAVNLNNYHTIEFRLFRGTLKYSTFIAML